MLTFRGKQSFLLGILAVLLVAIIPWPAQASDYGTQELQYCWG